MTAWRSAGSNFETVSCSGERRYVPRVPLAFANYVPATARAHSSRVHPSSRNITALALTKCSCLGANLQGELALQNNVCGLGGVGVLGITGIRPILPDVSLRESLLAQFLHDFFLVHIAIIPRLKTETPSLQQWGSLQKGRAVFRREAR